MVGVDVNAIYRLTFILAFGLADALVGAIFMVSPTMGDLPALKALTVGAMGAWGISWARSRGRIHLQRRNAE